jgi:hypothetical protein
MESLKTFLDTPSGGVAAFAVGALVILILFQIHRRIIADRKYAGQVANVEANLGFTTLWTAPLSLLSNGDNLGAIKALKAKFDHYSQPGNLATELTAVFQKNYTTNTAFASDVDDFMAKLKSGDAAGAAADVAKIAKDTGFAEIGPPPAIVAFNHLKEKMDALKANPTLAGLLAHVPDAQGILAGVVTAAHDTGVAAAAAANPPAALAAAALPVVPAGHTMTVTNTASA